MKKLFLTVSIALIITGCKSFEDLDAGNKLAIENQSNLESNVLRQLDNFKKLGQSTGKWDDNDEKIWTEQKDVIIQQLAINRAWLIVIQEAISSDSVNSELFGEVLKDLPGWVKDGKDIYDLIKTKSK
jgi:hypothetical protein